MTRIQLNNISKRYTRKYIFKDITSEVVQGEVMILKGFNGSGKSTLLKVIAQFIPLTKGNLRYEINGTMIDKTNCFNYMGFNAPYFNVFNDLTAIENIKVLLKSRLQERTPKEINALLDKFQLNKKGHILVQNFSSGMQQRIKLLCATLFNPEFLFLDEPTSNLDLNGKELIKECIESQRKRGVTVICTNEENEVSWGDVVVDLNTSN